MTYKCPGCGTLLDSIKSMGTHIQHGDGSCTLEKRFDGRCEHLPNGCIVYKGATDKWGYAHVGVGGKRVQAHRYAYERFNGPIPKGMLVCHSCDNPPCVNPKHLFLGTDMQNTQDMIRKGRKPVGEKVKGGKYSDGAKLTEAQVREIRSLKGSDTQRAIGDTYGVDQATISAIWKGRTWKHLL